MREGLLARTGAGSELAHTSSSRWPMPMEGGARGVLHAEYPSPCCPEGRRIAFVQPPFCFSYPPGSHPRSRCFPSVLNPAVVHCTCAIATGSICRTRYVRCLPMHTLGAILATWVIRVHTSHLAATHGTQHSPDRLIRHAHPHARSDGAVLPARPGFRTVAHAEGRSFQSGSRTV
jgi:hypothetical protein